MYIYLPDFSVTAFSDDFEETDLTGHTSLCKKWKAGSGSRIV
jgi:hypothetical protein